MKKKNDRNVDGNVPRGQEVVRRCCLAVGNICHSFSSQFEVCFSFAQSLSPLPPLPSLHILYENLNFLPFHNFIPPPKKKQRKRNEKYISLIFISVFYSFFIKMIVLIVLIVLNGHNQANNRTFSWFSRFLPKKIMSFPGI